MDPLDQYLTQLQEEERNERFYESINAELDKQVAEDMRQILKVKKTPLRKKPPPPPNPAPRPSKLSTLTEIDKIAQQIMDDEADLYQSMNTELDKQVAKDMAAIKNYLSMADESIVKRIAFFNSIANANAGNENHMSDHILYQHTPLGNIRWHECTQCSFKTTEMSQLRDHILAKHTTPGSSDWFTCPTCPYMTKDNADLQRHLREAHDSTSDIIFKCKDCDGEFKENSELFQHMRQVHSDVTVKCDKCLFVTADDSTLRQHMLAEHHKLNISWYKCAKCSYRTVRKANLDRHIMYKHSNTRVLL